MNGHQRLILAGAVVIASGAVLTAMWRMHMFPRSTVPVSEMNGRQLAQYAQGVYHGFRVESIADAPSPDAVLGFLEGAAIEDEDAAASGDLERDRDELLRFVAEFLYYRYVQGSVDVYKRWRREHGYVLKPTDRLIKTWTVPEDYELFFGEPYPGDDAFERVFDRFWNDGLSRKGEASRVVGVCVDPEARGVAFGSTSVEDPGVGPFFEGKLGVYLWLGRSGGTMRNWWSTPQGEFDDWLATVGRARLGTVSLIAQFESGDRFPMQVQFYQDPQSRKWWLLWITVNNVLDNSVGATEY